MAISISGAVLSGIGSPFLINEGKRSGVVNGPIKVGRKNMTMTIAPNRKKWLVPAAVKGDSGNSNLDPKWLDDASEKASEYVKEKGSEVGHMSAQRGQEVKDFIVERAVEAIDILTENAQRASDFVTERGKETKKEAVSMAEKAKDFIVEKVGEANDTATDISKKTAKYVAEKAAEAKEAILPPKT